MHDFRDRWKPMVAIIQRDAARAFAAGGDATGRALARACLDDLYRRYKDFLAALTAQGGAFAAVAQEGPSSQTLAYELRELVR